MAYFVAYRKYIDTQVTRELRLPCDARGETQGRELCTIDGLTYVSLADGTTLPAEQPDGVIALPVALTPALLEQIKAVSAQARFIQSILDSTGEDPYNADAKAWATAEKARLGL